MIIAETALVVSVLFTVPKRQDSSRELVCATDAIRRSFTMSSGMSLERKMTLEFAGIPGVSDVRVAAKGRTFSFEVSLASFDKVTRRKVYAKEKELYREFPAYDFEFVVIDASWNMEHAFAG